VWRGSTTLALVVALATAANADSLAGLPDMTAAADAIVNFTYAGTDYVVADGDLTLGETTRWWVDDQGNEILWDPDDPATAPPSDPPPVSGTSNPKSGDIGAKADNFLLRLDGSNDISSIDGINFQETIFPHPADTFFLFERGGNDAGTWQAINADRSPAGPLVEFTKGTDGGPLAFYADTGVNVGGQNAWGVVFTTDGPVDGVRITASGHDTLSISVPVPEPTSLLLASLGLVGVVASYRRYRS
jgi:hypothetical protein